MAMLCMAIALVCCSGSDGETGLQGETGPKGDSIKGDKGDQGDPGTDGISCWDLNGNGVGDITVDETNEDINLDGVLDALDCQGDDGQNGNANVQEFEYNLDAFNAYSQLNLSLETIVDVPSNYAYLFYIDTPGGLRYSLPGNLVNNTHYARVFINKTEGTFRINFYGLNDMDYQVPGGTYSHVIVVAIELSNTGKTSENVMAELKAAGVDTSDYNAVAEYFGLDKQ